MTLGELLVGKKVRATKDCFGAKKGEVYEVKKDSDNLIEIEGCSCVGSWELISPFNYKPHKHILRCSECGEEVK
mgnify:CR=1 FL=1